MSVLRFLRFWKTHNLTWADGTIFMTRYTLIKRPSFSLKVHRFRRGDEEMHDHPWAFISLILWRGYVELTPDGPIKRRWLSLRYRPAHWIHNVCVNEGEDAWTLCLTFGRQRVWGFHTPVGWMPHDDFRRINGRAKVTDGRIV
jgi:hypothetical protein